MYTMALFIKSLFILGLTCCCSLAAFIMMGMQALFTGGRCRCR